MKNILCVLSTLVALSATAQVKKDSVYMSQKELVGVWQRNFKEVGNGLLQNIKFFNDSTFEVEFANGNEDLRDIWGLKGTYRLEKESLYLTIKSREVYEGGQVSIVESNESGKIFHFTDGTLKELKEPDPRESPQPINITVIGKGKIMLINETYYKLTKQDLRNEGIEGKF